MIDKQELLAILEAPEEEARLEAVRGLVKAADLQAVQLLKQVAGNDPSPQVRYYAQKGLDHLSRRLAADEAAPGADKADVGPRGRSEILGKLAGILAGGNRDVKLKALQVVALHGFREGLPTVLEHLPKEEDPFVRSKLLLSIGLLGGRPEIPVLATATEDPDPRIRANAVEALEYIGHRSIYPPIIRLLQDQDHRVRANSVKALRNYGHEQVIQVLDEMLSSVEVRMRDAALFACLTFGADVSVPRLAKLLEDPAGPLRQKAFHALGRLAERGCEPAAKVLSGRRPEAGEQEKMLDYFTLLDQAMTMEEDVPARLGHADFRVRLAAIHQILRDKKAVYLPLLTERLGKETDGYVKATLVTAIGKLGGMAVVGELTPFLEDPDPRLRANATEALGEMGIETLWPKLRLRLADTNNRARGNAVVALRDDQQTEIPVELDKMLKGDELMKLSACWVVSKLGQELLVGRLEQLLEDPAEKVRAKALATLASMAPQSAEAAAILSRRSTSANIEAVLNREFEPAEAGKLKTSLEVERLVFDLRSTDAAVRLDAIRLLADIGDLSAVEPLIPSIRAASGEERLGARQAIVRIFMRQESEERTSRGGELDASAGGQDAEAGSAIEQILAAAASPDAAVNAVLRLALTLGRKPVIRGIRDRLKAGCDGERLLLLLILAGLLGGTDILLRFLDSELAPVKQMAREGLEAIQGDHALAAVLPHVRSTSRTVRHNTIRALRLFPKAKVVQACRRLLRSSDPKARESGIYILTKLEYDESFEVLLEYFRVEEDLDLAKKAAGTIARLATPADRRMIEALLDAAGNTGKAELARKILSKLPGQKPSEAAPKASNVDPSLSDLSSPDVSTSGLMSSEHRQQCIDDLSHPDPEVRKNALTELARTKDLSLMPIIRKVAFTDPDARVAFFAKNTHDNLELGMLPHVELKKQGEVEFSVGRFTGYLESPDPRVRVAAVKKAVTLGEKKVVQFLEKKIKEEQDDWVLATLLMALGELGDKRVGGTIAPFLKRRDPRLRSVAIASMAEVKDDSVFPLLTPALMDDDADVAEVAFMSLKRLTEDDLTEYACNMCESKKQELADRGVQLVLRLKSPKAMMKQLDLLARFADKVILNKLAASLAESGSREILTALVEREDAMLLPKNEWTQKIRTSLCKALGSTEDEVRKELAEKKAERKAARAASAPALESAAPPPGSVVSRLKDLFWKK
ncbi:MAG: HEAT repeat domain-containing protein [Candidatus Wallbacteria bacterium]|nr:HEAT repeat domain-containing protein [Candidatus Wallbacteria bacterium]